MNNKINLLFIPYTFSNGGGAEKILQILVNHLPLDKYNITIQEVENFGKDLQLNNGIVYKQAFWDQTFLGKLFYQYNYILLLYFPGLLRKVFLLDKTDVVITYNYQLPSFMLPAFKKEKKIAWFHSDIYDLNESNYIWEKVKQKKVWGFADIIIAISNYSLKSLQDLFPEFMNKSRIIHNGMDFSSCIQLSKEECDFDFSGSPVLLCIGRIDQRKNFQFAIKILSELKKQNVNCRLLIIGEGELKKDVIQLAESLNVIDYVYFAGFQTNPYKYISRAKLLCVTSLSEGWPTVVMEAMSLGIPFVTTPVAGASDELACNGKCGFVSNYDEKEYAVYVKKLLDDETLYREMSENCKENVKQYTAENYAADFISLVNELYEKNKLLIQKKKVSPIILIFSYILYFLLFIISICEIIYRIMIIKKRIYEKNHIKTIKNLIYLFGIIILLPFICIIKILCFPFFIRKIFCKSVKKCRL